MTSDQAVPMADLSNTFSFKKVDLFKDQSLGIGSYGAVCKAKCDDLVCAAKILHPTLFDSTIQHQISPHHAHRVPIRRFEQECEFMSAIRHPNIVQYLGTFRDLDTHLPVLMMELMDDSLTNFLQMSPGPLPYHFQVNLSHDITLALAFLHSNNVIHRDLSSNNVLLMGNIRAKVTDFGMARLGELSSLGTNFSSTTCPGTNAYMPPESIQDKPEYTEKLDCFSLGVLIVQILTRQYPKPGDQLQEINVDHPQLPAGKALVRVSEVNRRQNHISEIDPNHPLLPVIFECLKDNESERPSAHLISERLRVLKQSSAYTESIRVERKAIRRCMSDSDNVNRAGITSHQPSLQQALAKEQEFQSKKQIYHLTQKLRVSEYTIAQLTKQITDLKTQQSQREKSTDAGMKLFWRNGKRAPRRMSRWSDVAIDGSTVYVRNSNTREIYAYDTNSDNWTRLPDCATFNCAIVFVNSLLTTVGGNCHDETTNELFSLTEESSNGKWDQVFPPMPTKRNNTATLCTESELIVAGGSDGRMLLTSVEVMNIRNHQWSSTVDLPEPLEMASIYICQNHLYILGAYNSKSVYSCKFDSLLHNRFSEPQTKFKKIPSIWSIIAELPVSRCTCVSFQGKLLAIGGMERTKPTSSSAIYKYDSASDSWTAINDKMTSARCDCFSAVIDRSQTLIVIGGYVDNSYSQSDIVELTHMA